MGMTSCLVLFLIRNGSSEAVGYSKDVHGGHRALNAISVIDNAASS